MVCEALRSANSGLPYQTLTGIRGEFLQGITGERMVILDAARILADKDIVVHEEV